MKKFTALFLTVILAAGLFTACSSEKDYSDYDINEIYDTIREASEMRMPMDIDDEYILNYVLLQEDWYEEYKGEFCRISPGVDILLVVKAAPDHVEDVQQALEKRKNVINDTMAYLPNLKDKTEAGRIVVKEPFVILAIAGDENLLEESAEKMYEPIDAAIEEAFK